MYVWGPNNILSANILPGVSVCTPCTIPGKCVAKRMATPAVFFVIEEKYCLSNHLD